MIRIPFGASRASPKTPWFGFGVGGARAEKEGGTEHGVVCVKFCNSKSPADPCASWLQTKTPRRLVGMAPELHGSTLLRLASGLL